MVLLFSSCINDAVETTKHGEFELEFLFEKDSCKMYRFKDGSRYIYWSNCKSKVNYDYTIGGKSSTTHFGETITNK